MPKKLLLFVCLTLPLVAHADERPDPGHVVQAIDTIMVRGNQLSRMVAAQLDDARRFARTRQARCLDDVLSQVNAARRQLLFRRDAVTRRDADVRQHARMTRALRERFDALRGQARTCVGGSARAPNGTQVSVVVPEGVGD